ERADEREAHGVRHGMKKLARGTGEGVDGQVTRDDHGDGIKYRAVDVAGGREDDIGQLVFRAVPQAEFAVDVFDHDDGAVDDDAEIDGADGKEIRGFAGQVKEDESKKQREGNRQRGDDGGAETHQEKNQDDEDEHHAAEKIAFDGVGGDANEIAAVI